jgi:hypothetical protein
MPADLPDDRHKARSGLRRFAPSALVIVGIVRLVGASFATWRLTSAPSESHPAGGVWWRVTGGPESVSADDEADAPRLDQATIQTATEIPIVAYFPYLAGRPAPDDSWLGTPRISYTSTAVVITMPLSDSFDCGSSTATERPTCGWSLSPRYVQTPIHLSEPLGDRGLFDGSTDPPTQRWFSWSPAASIDLAAVKASYSDACRLLTVLDAVTCQQVKIEGMTAEGRVLAVPTTLGPADKDRAYAFCEQLALAHVDADAKVPGYEQLIRLLGIDGGGLTSCSIP